MIQIPSISINAKLGKGEKAVRMGICRGFDEIINFRKSAQNGAKMEKCFTICFTKN